MPDLVRQTLNSYIVYVCGAVIWSIMTSDMPSEAMFPDIYNHRILDLAGNIPRQGRLAAPDATAKAHSKLCGSTVIVDLVMADGQVVDFAHDVKACALGQAAASIMARHVIGSTGPELRALRDQVRAMLKENGPPPNGRWSDIAILEPVRDFKARHASTLLAFDATVDCVNQIEAAANARDEADLADSAQSSQRNGVIRTNSS